MNPNLLALLLLSTVPCFSLGCHSGRTRPRIEMQLDLQPPAVAQTVSADVFAMFMRDLLAVTQKSQCPHIQVSTPDVRPPVVVRILPVDDPVMTLVSIDDRELALIDLARPLFDQARTSDVLKGLLQAAFLPYPNACEVKAMSEEIEAVKATVSAVEHAKTEQRERAIAINSDKWSLWEEENHRQQTTKAKEQLAEVIKHREAGERESRRTEFHLSAAAKAQSRAEEEGKKVQAAEADKSVHLKNKEEAQNAVRDSNMAARHYKVEAEREKARAQVQLSEATAAQEEAQKAKKAVQEAPSVVEWPPGTLAHIDKQAERKRNQHLASKAQHELKARVLDEHSQRLDRAAQKNKLRAWFGKYIAREDTKKIKEHIFRQKQQQQQVSKEFQEAQKHTEQSSQEFETAEKHLRAAEQHSDTAFRAAIRSDSHRTAANDHANRAESHSQLKNKAEHSAEEHSQRATQAWKEAAYSEWLQERQNM